MFIPAGTPRQNTSFSTIELKSSDGESWYNALIIDVRRRLAGGVSVQSSYTLSKSEDTTQASTFFSDATNGTTSAMPEYIAGYNKGPSDFDTRHNWVMSFSWELPFARNAARRRTRARRRLAGVRHLDDAERTAADGVRHREPVALAVEPVARPGHRPGPAELRARLRRRTSAINGTPEQWFNPAAFVLQPAGTFGNTGRGDFVGPEPAHARPLVQQERPQSRALATGTRLELRIEVFNMLNRANFGVPELRAFAGQADGEAPLATFGRISNTVTASRQTQVSFRVTF